MGEGVEFVRDRDDDVWEATSDGGWTCITVPSMTLSFEDLVRDFGPLERVTTDPRTGEED